MRELTEAELEQVNGGDQGPPFGGNQGGGPGNSGPGDKNSPVQGPPPGKDPHFPGNAD
jgi:bacteriocin-like protein